MAIKIKIRGMKNAIGTLSHFVIRWGNAPSVKNAAMSAMRGRNKLRTKNQAGRVVYSIFYFSLIENFAEEKIAINQTAANHVSKVEAICRPKSVFNAQMVMSGPNVKRAIMAKAINITAIPFIIVATF